MPYRPPHSHGNDDSGIDSDEKRGPLLNIMSKVSQISQLASELTTANHSTKEEEEEEFGTSEHGQSPVVVIGPLGTEPQRGVSCVRFGGSESVVYSRSSLQLPMSSQSLNVEDIPPKDTPRVHAEVYAFVRSDEDYLYNRRMTRSGARGMAPVKPLYTEGSSESETSDEGATVVRPKHHQGKKLQREKVRSHHRKTEREHHVQNTVGVKLSIEDVSVPSQELSDGTDSATPSDEVGSSDLQTSPLLEDASGLVQLPTFDVATSEEYETAPEFPCDSSSHVAFEAPGQDPEHLVVPSTATSSGDSTPCSDTSPISSPLVSTVKPSGIETVLNELQTSYSRKSLKLRASQSVKRVLSYPQPKSLELLIKPCSVVVERLPYNVLAKLTKKLGRESSVEARQVGRESSLDSDATAMSPGSFSRSTSGTEMDRGCDMQIPQITRGGTARLKVLQKNFPKSLASQLKGSKQGWSSDSDFDVHSHPGVGRETRRGFSSLKNSGEKKRGDIVTEEREEALLRGKQAKYTKSPKGKGKASSGEQVGVLMSLKYIIMCSSRTLPGTLGSVMFSLHLPLCTHYGGVGYGEVGRETKWY